MTQPTLTTIALLGALAGAITLTSRAEAKDPDDRAIESANDWRERGQYARALEALDGRLANGANPRLFKLACEIAAEGIDAKRYWNFETALGYCDRARLGKLAEKIANRLIADKMKKAKKDRDGSYYDDAAKTLREAIAARPRPAIYLELCEVLELGGKPAEAMKACAKAAAGGNGAAKTRLAALKHAEATKPNDAQQALIAGLEECAGTARLSDQKATKSCVDRFAAARRGGVRDDHSMKAPDEFKGPIIREQKHSYGWWRYAKVGDVRPFVEGLFLDRALAPLAYRLKEVVDSTATASGAEGKGWSLTDLTAETAVVSNCRKAAAAALAEGVDPKHPVEVGGRTVALGAIDAAVCTPLASKLDALRIAEKARLEAERQKKIAPYRGVLKGDKLALVIDLELWNFELRRRGGEVISTPKQLARAGAWYIARSGRDDVGIMSWTVEKFRFRGHKLAGKSFVGGLGSTPPRRAYR